MNDREHRLRERIDMLTDERDRARDQLTKARAVRRQLRQRVYALERSLALWRTRALNRRR